MVCTSDNIYRKFHKVLNMSFVGHASVQTDTDIYTQIYNLLPFDVGIGPKV